MTVGSAGSLTILGTGIRLASQITLEALEAIKSADVVLYLAGDAATPAWLRQLNPSAESLSDCYREGRPRSSTYREIAGRILSHVRAGRRVAAAFYGHPGVGVNPAHAALRRARREGYPARMLPGISADACLVAELGVDPLVLGWQSHEASEFLSTRPKFDPRCALVLWQLGLIYQPSISFSGHTNPRGVADLARALRASYPASHGVVLYEASPFPVCDSRIEPAPLRELATRVVRLGTTLYVPPLARRR